MCERSCTSASRAYQTLRETPYTSRSMGGASVTRVYVHPVVDDAGRFVYDKEDPTVYEKTGYAVYYTDAQFIGRVTVTPSETVNNPVSVSLRNGSEWTVTGPSHLASLTIEDGSAIRGKLYVNGTETQAAPGSYEGNLLVLP